MPEPARRGANYLRLIGLAALIGIPAAFVAALFLAVVNWLERWLWTDLPGYLGASAPPWYLVLGLPMVGACVVVAARTLLPGDGGHQPLGGLSMAPTPLRNGPGIALAAIGTLAFGAVLGPEAPLIALGSVVGMTVAPLLKGNERARSVVATAGSFSAISALFGGPLVAGMLMVEAGIGAGAQLIVALLPGLVAAAIGYLIFVGFGTWGGLHETSLTVPNLPPYEDLHIGDLLVCIVVGLAAALVLAGVRWIGTRVDGIHLRRGNLSAVLLGGGLVVGLLALAARALGADSQDVLFSGQAAVPGLVAEKSLTIVIVLLVAKALAYGVCLGCGFRGGPVFPAIFIGIALASIAELVFDMSPTLAVAAGTAAGMAAGTRLLFAPLLFALLLVGTNGIDAIPAAVLASASAWVMTTVLRPGAMEETTRSVAPPAD
jgi:chloride channel protein, CIC family